MSFIVSVLLGMAVMIVVTVVIDAETSRWR